MGLENNKIPQQSIFLKFIYHFHHVVTTKVIQNLIHHVLSMQTILKIAYGVKG